VLTSPPPGAPPGFAWHSGDNAEVLDSIVSAIEATGVAIKDAFIVIGKALGGEGESGSEPSGE
jgi:hypothetical protein